MPTKSQLRKRCWQGLRDAEAARFPGVEGRIPNFVGAEAAAARLTELPEFVAARAIKANPDSPQRAVRRAALRAGKTVFMAVPRLRSEHPFLVLDPTVIDPPHYWAASSIKGSSQFGTPIGLQDMPPIDLIVTGCVGVGREGARLGKGGGYSDLEFALLREHGRVDENTPIVSTVHPCQLLRRGTVPVESHDITLDAVCTPQRTLRFADRPARPSGVDWALLDPDKRDAIPVLQTGRT